MPFFLIIAAGVLWSLATGSPLGVLAWTVGGTLTVGALILTETVTDRIRARRSHR